MTAVTIQKGNPLEIEIVAAYTYIEKLGQGGIYHHFLN